MYSSNWPNRRSAPDFGTYRHAVTQSKLFDLVLSPEDSCSEVKNPPEIEELDKLFKIALDKSD